MKNQLVLCVVVINLLFCLNNISAQQDLTPAGLPEHAAFGISTAIDEPYIMVGQPRTLITNDQGTVLQSSGRVRVYNNNGVFIKDLVPDNTFYGPHGFGSSLATAPGLLAIGAPSTSAPGNHDSGAVYVFHNQLGDWTQSACIALTNISSYSLFGYDVALLPDWLFVSAPWNNVTATNYTCGSVHVFHRDNDQTFIETQVLVRTPLLDNTRFGRHIAADGTTLAITSQEAPRKIYIYNLVHDVWQLAEVIESPVSSYNWFGWSLALHGDRLFVGVSNLIIPRIYVYERNGGTWGAPTTYIEPPTDYLKISFGVDMAFNSQYALIMANSGAALFQQTGTNWISTATYNLPNEIDGGCSCSISEQHFVLGTSYINTWRGAAFLYNLSATPPGAPSDPSPRTGWSLPVDPMPEQVSWVNGTGTETVDLFFGTNNPPTQLLLNGAAAVTNVNLPALDFGTKYYWQVVAHNAAGTSPGPIWWFVSAGSPAAFSVGPTNLNFGNVLVNTTSAKRYFNITNSGGHAFTGIITPPPRYALSYISIWGNTNNYPVGLPVPYSVDPGYSPARYFVRFMPQQAGNQDGIITITSSDTNHLVNHIKLHATGALPPPEPPSRKEPADGATNQQIINEGLHWGNGTGTTSAKLYFGTNSNALALESSGTSKFQDYKTGHLAWNTTYYWQVVCCNDYGSTTGAVWSFTTKAEPAYLNVESPNGYEYWPVGQSHEIVWAPGLTKDLVRIDLMHNSGSGYTVYQSLATTDNDGSYYWTPTATVSNDDYRIQITSITNSAKTDISDADFHITEGQTLTLTSPNGGESWPMGATRNITWASSGISGDINISLYTTINGYTQLENTIATSVTNIGSYAWTIPTGERVDNHYLICISAANVEIGDFSDNTFSLSSPTTLSITAPYANTHWAREASHIIRWNTEGSIPQVDIYLQRDNNSPILIEKNVANTNSYSWYITTGIPPDTNYLIKVVSSADDSIVGNSGRFRITPKLGHINVTFPEKDLRLNIGDRINIKWEDNDVIGPIDIELWANGKYKTMNIASNLSDTGIWQWNIAPGTPTNQLSQLRIVDAGNPDTSGFSPFFDLEEPPALQVTSPNGGESWRIDQNHSITWNSTNIGGTVRIELYEQNVLAKTIEEEIRNTGSYVWNCDETVPGAFYRICVRDTAHTDIYDMSDTNFTLTDPLPGTPYSPWPANGTTNIPATIVLAAQLGAYTDTCDIYLGTNNPPTTMILTNVPSANFRLSNLKQLQTYYWRIVGKNNTGNTIGPVWQIITRREPLQIRGVHIESGGIRVEWGVVGKVTAYHIWGSDNLTNEFHKLRTCTTNEILDTEHSGTTHYFYKITATPQEQ